MAWILNIETTTTNCSVSLCNKGQLVALREDNNERYSHSENLHCFISEVIEEANISKSELDAIAISEGPGSYTGLRIGVSAAKGLCYALEIPLISISTLESIANRINPKSGLIIPLMDARRMEVYSAVFNFEHREIRGVKAEVLSQSIYEEYLNGNEVNLIGNATEKAKTVIDHKNAKFYDNELPSSKEMAGLSYIKYQSNTFEDVAYFEPNYLKEFQGNKLK